MARTKQTIRQKRPTMSFSHREFPWWTSQTMSGKRVEIVGTTFADVKGKFLALYPNAKELWVFESKTGKTGPGRYVLVESRSSSRASSRSSSSRSSRRSSSSSNASRMSVHSSKRLVTPPRQRSSPRRASPYVSPRSPPRITNWNALNERLLRIGAKANAAIHRVEYVEKDVAAIQRRLGMHHM